MKLGDLIDATIEGSVDEILLFESGTLAVEDVDAVHRLRVAVRRLRSDLQTFRKSFDDSCARHARAELAWLGQCLGAVRDMDVLAERLRAREPFLLAEDRAGLAQILRAVDADRALGQRKLHAAFASARYRALVGELTPLGNAATMALPSSASKERRRKARDATKLVARRWRALVRGVDALPCEPSSTSLLLPSDAELHALRILAKRCRYAAESSASIVGDDARRFAGALEQVQSVLGDHQDSVAAEAWLRTASRETASLRFAAGELVILEQSDRARCRNAWHDVWRRASKRGLRAWL